MRQLITVENVRPLLIFLAWMSVVWMFFPIHIQLIGEESVFAVYFQNMVQTSDYMNAFYRPPLFLWVSMGLDHLFHFDSIELPLRMASILSSVCGALFAGLFAHKVFQKEHAALLGFLVFLTLGEIQFWYGWLGYADAMFMFFIFSSMVSIWLAAQEEKTSWYLLAVVLINAAFFTKALSAYLFFFTTLAVSAYGFGSWRFFLRPAQLLILPLLAVAPMLWASLHGSGAESTSAGLVEDIARRFTTIDMVSYLKHVVVFPVEFLARMAPVSLLLIYVMFRQPPAQYDKEIRMIALIFLINYLPYWLAPFSNMRHVVPLYGWGSLVLTYLLLQYDFKVRQTALVAIAVVLFLKIPFSFWGLPFLKERDETQAFLPVAEDMIVQVKGEAIRQSSVSFTGFAVTAYINQIQKGQPNILFYTPQDHGVYVIAHEQLAGTQLVKKYTLFNDPVYLLYQE